MPVITPDERDQFTTHLQEICDLVNEMVAVEALREGVTIEEFNRKYGTCLKDDPEIGEACRCETCLREKAVLKPRK